MKDPPPVRGTGLEIAIIGMAARVPGARDVAQFWRNLREGVESITFFSEEELEQAGESATLLREPAYVRAKGVLADAECFDAGFFGFSPREAEAMDPQQRLLLECAWEALEDAGYEPARYEGAVGVCAGMRDSTYHGSDLSAAQQLTAALGTYQALIGSSKDFLTTHVSYKLNLTGPSISVQTACSTSLVAVHLACQNLLSGESDLMLAGGVAVRFPQRRGYLYQEGMIFSPDGRCRAFDTRARGTVSGEGVGIVVLKRLADALADGDCVRAVIKGSAVNNDGSLKVGYTAPAIEGQARVILAAQAMADVDPGTIGYVEAHGTGTPLGDPIEVKALTRAFRAGTDGRRFCALGSVKTNVGHLDAAAGVVGLIKTALALEHGLLPPSLHFETPNAALDLEESPFYVNRRLAEWRMARQRRRAGVSSFGIGGTNAHVVLEEAPPRPPSSHSRSRQLLVLSARTPAALDQITVNLAAHLRSHPEHDLADVAWTLQVGRSAFEHRRTLVCGDRGEAALALETLDPVRVLSARRGAQPRVAWLFSGQGAQHASMGRGLYQSEPVFREQVDSCSAFLEPHLGLDLRRLLYPEAGNAADAADQLRRTRFAQAALFVVEYALARLWMAWGVEPQGMLGHSIGEYVAACLAGVFSLEDGLALVADRGRLMQALPGGAMLAVPLPEDEVRGLLVERLSLAAVNAPALCVVSGPTHEIEELEAALSRRRLAGRRLATSHAFHSAMMDPAVEEFGERVSRVRLQPPRIPYLSNVSGTWIRSEEATDPGYWARHLRQTVRFADGVRELLSDPDRLLVEVGPGSTLASLARQQAGQDSRAWILASLPGPDSDRSDPEFVLGALGRLWLAGVEPDWKRFHSGEQLLRVPLPTYPFERTRYSLDSASATSRSSPAEASHPTLHLRAPSPRPAERAGFADWFYRPTWKRASDPLPRFPRAGEACERWLLFMDGCGLGARMAQRLQERGQQVVKVTAGNDFAAVEEGSHFTVAPADRAGHHALLEALRRCDKMPRRIVHLWSVTEPASRSSQAAFGASQAHGFFTLLCLAQALGEVAPGETFDITVVSNGIHEVTGEEALVPEQATLLGPCRVIPQEYPGWTCRNVDLELAGASGATLDALAARLLAEIAQPSGPVVALRGKHRWVAAFEPLPLDGSVTEDRSPLRNGGVYLVTGGLGGIGLVLAEHLARTVHARLVLTGRTSLPPREQWEAWLRSHPQEDDLGPKMRRVWQLEELGAEVLVVEGDVASQADMEKVVASARARFGDIQGVIHAAGVAGGGLTEGLIQVRSPEAAAAVLRAKVEGTLVLAGLLDPTKMDFFVLCSSLSSFMGGIGRVDYCAANAFLDACAHTWRSPAGRGPVSINWDGWRDVGMAVTTRLPAGVEAARQQALSTAIAPSEGALAFSWILRAPIPQVAVSTRPLEARLEEEIAIAASAPVRRGRVGGSAPEPSHPRPALSRPYVAPEEEVERAVASIWQDLLGVDRVGLHDDFLELGGHSLLATQAVSRLRERFGVNLGLAALLEAPTVAAVGERVRDLLWIKEGTARTMPLSDGAEEVEL